MQVVYDKIAMDNRWTVAWERHCHGIAWIINKNPVMCIPKSEILGINVRSTDACISGSHVYAQNFRFGNHVRPTDACISGSHIYAQNFRFEDPSGHRPKREEALSGTDMYHRTKFHADRYHRRPDIWADRDRANLVPCHTNVWRVTISIAVSVHSGFIYNY